MPYLHRHRRNQFPQTGPLQTVLKDHQTLGVDRSDFASCKRGFFGCPRGFTLIELMIVITIILVLISIAAPIYRSSIIRSKEAVLRDNLFTLRSLIDQYTLDKQKGPQSLEDLVAEGYLRELPVDPFTNSNQTWQVVYDDSVMISAAQTEPGIIDVHSGSNLLSLSGEPYSSW